MCILKQFYALCVPWLHEKQIEDEPKDGRTEGRIDGRSQSGQSANSWGAAPELNRWPHRQPLPPMPLNNKSLACIVESFGRFLPPPHLSRRTQKSIGTISGTIINNGRWLAGRRSLKPDFSDIVLWLSWSRFSN